MTSRGLVQRWLHRREVGEHCSTCECRDPIVPSGFLSYLIALVEVSAADCLAFCSVLLHRAECRSELAIRVRVSPLILRDTARSFDRSAESTLDAAKAGSCRSACWPLEHLQRWLGAQWNPFGFSLAARRVWQVR